MRSYYSTIIDRPAPQVWALVRDFNNYPGYIEGVDRSVIEDEKSGDAVGAVRSFRYRGNWIRQRLVALSDADRSFTYAGLSPLAFPAGESHADSPAPINYEGTLRIAPVTNGDRAFVEWWLTYDCSADERDCWDAFLVAAISQWAGSLERTVCNGGAWDRK